MASLVRFGPRLREIRIHLCQKSSSSKGVRDFIEQHYVDLKKTNPQFPILIRECSGVKPTLWTREDRGKETAISLQNLTCSEVLTKIQQFTK